jgi:hypothetical protein
MIGDIILSLIKCSAPYDLADETRCLLLISNLRIAKDKSPKSILVAELKGTQQLSFEITACLGDHGAKIVAVHPEED